MLRKKPLIIFAAIGAALTGALIRMAFTAFEGTSANSKKATWEYFCASFGDDNPLPYRIALKQGNEGEELKAEGFDNGEVLETLKRLSPRLATEEEVEEAALIPDDGYGRDLWFGTCDRSNPDGYKELTLTINDTNIATVEWIDEHYWNSLFRNRYWLEVEEIDCLVDVVVKVARANIVTGKGIAGGDSLGREILGEMKEEGIKFSKDKIVFAARLKNGSKIFLETGNANSGLQHIVTNHGSQFFQVYGVKSDQLGGFLHDLVAKGKHVTSFRYDDPLGREGYRNVYYWKGSTWSSTESPETATSAPPS